MKKRHYSLLYFVFLVLIVSACASIATTSPGADDSKKKTAAGAPDQPKTEDLSKYRPKFALADAAATNPAGKGLAAGIVPTNHVNDRVAALMDTLAYHNKSIRYARGYRILAYSGTERKAWLDMRQAIVKRVPEERDYPIYTQPNYRLKIGDYFTRVEAQQVLLRIKDITPKAMIIADQINVK
jgi:hypothetical protein